MMPGDISLIERLRERALDPTRATDEHLDPGWTPPISHVASPVLTPERLFELEQEMGSGLPELLRQVYTQVGEGNFGPGYGLMPFKDHKYTSSSAAVLPLYQSFLEKGWPEHLLMFCCWGCTIYSVINLQTEQVGVLDLEGWDESTPAEDCIFWQKSSLQDWFEAWLAGENLFFELDEE
ncbi:SMI1/KNR4 family protein [Deinococcus roseus]|uniref:Knr4/Smi1-like domain-containing protein n=1 Tax=Deinococcus roseus TaxID=392414 RepID=A0ABQ2CVB3_9DEIO|nr:SMI1/KNR4 family protein [Deinococcus roseus]GGJ24237.1 hypothetical protein GCM10008938_07980 [Deinococcus roseus]